MNVFEIILQEITDIFGNNISWIALANEILSYIITTILLLLFLALPIYLCILIIKKLSGTDTDMNTIKSRRRKR